MSIAVLSILTVVLLVIGVPVGVAIGMGMISVAFLFQTTKISFIAQAMYSTFESLPLTAIPCFMLAGAIMETGGLSRRLVNVANKLVGFTTGGLGTVTVLACMFFGAISGSGPATVAAIGSIMIPYMLKEKYDHTYATALSSSAGGLGIIVPPSIPLVVYGIATNTSIGDLFLAGIGPAFVVGILLIVTNIIMAKRNGYSGNGEGFILREIFKAIWDAKWALIMPLIILGGIYGGIFTPTEAAVVAIVYGSIIGIFVYKELKPKQILKLLDSNCSFVGGFMLTFAPAAALGAILNMLGVPGVLTAFLFSISTNKFVILFIVNIFLTLVGMVVDTTSANIIFSPILLAALRPYGIDPIHFGLIMTINLAIGFVTPPLAGNLFVASGMTGIPIEKIAKKAIPFIIAMFIALMIVSYFPITSLGILRLFGR
jgi:C4-dicarboxylate transporter DctM subunit